MKLKQIQSDLAKIYTNSALRKDILNKSNHTINPILTNFVINNSEIINRFAISLQFKRYYYVKKKFKFTEKYHREILEETFLDYSNCNYKTYSSETSRRIDDNLKFYKFLTKYPNNKTYPKKFLEVVKYDLKNIKYKF